MGKTAILCYHRVFSLDDDYNFLCVHPSNFEEQIKFISQNYDVVRLSSEREEWSSGNKNSIILTFDDGYHDLLYFALPILRKYSIPATVFISTENLESGRENWTDAVLRAIFAPNQYNSSLTLNHEKWGGITIPADTLQNRIMLYNSLRSIMRLSEKKDRDIILRQLYIWAGLNNKGRDNRRMLTQRELRVLSECDLIDIGAHTVSHASLGNLSKGEQFHEISDCKNELERLCGKEIDLFAYPFGQRNDYSDITIELLKQSGFRRSVTTVGHLISNDDNDYELPRFIVRNYSIDSFANYLNDIFNTRETKRKLNNDASRLRFCNNVFSDKELLEGKDDLVIWGCGYWGRILLNEIVSMGIENRIVGFCDNDSNMWGKNYEGISVLSRDSVSSMKDHVLILIMNSHDWEIASDLLDNGFKNIRIYGRN